MLSFFRIINPFRKNTTYSQLFVSLVASVLLISFAGIYLIIDEQKKVNSHLTKEYAAQRIQGLIQLIDKTPPDARAEAISLLSVLPNTFTLNMPWQADDARIKDEYSQKLRSYLLTGLDSKYELQFIDLNKSKPEDYTAVNFVNDPKFKTFHSDITQPYNHRELFLQVKLSDDAVVTIHFFRPDELESLAVRFIVVFLICAFFIVLIGSWGIYRITKPLETLADYAIQIGNNLESTAPDMDGPKEINVLMASFEKMRQKLRDYIEARTQALYAVSHDLRLPLTRIRILIDRDDLPTGVKESVIQDLDEMNDMVGQTIDFLKIGKESESFSVVNINSLIDVATERFEDLGMIIQMDGRISKAVAIQPNAIMRCFNNILGNAHRYGGDTIDIQLSETETHLLIAIADNGPGIPESELSNVLEPYIRIENSRSKETGGTGLGLSIARKIIENHDGKIWLESPEGKGLTVFLQIPFQQNIES